MKKTTSKARSGEGLYVVLISVHGLIRGENLELGRDADTGGQTKYVVELARALAANPEVGRVDLLTRQVYDARVSDDYAVPEEPLGTTPGSSACPQGRAATCARKRSGPTSTASPTTPWGMSARWVCAPT
jgi:sucrose-phosphate synthase